MEHLRSEEAPNTDSSPVDTHSADQCVRAEGSAQRVWREGMLGQQALTEKGTFSRRSEKCLRLGDRPFPLNAPTLICPRLLF